MLNLIVGTSGTGKTHEMHNLIIESAEKNKVIVIVPEQYSFATERALQKKLTPKGKQNVEVLSFTRLCHTLFVTYTGNEQTPLDDSGRHILMSLALTRVKDDLTLYSNYCDKIEFISSMVMTVTEFDNAGITPKAFSDIAFSCKDSFSKKLKDIAMIYTAYDIALSEVGLENSEYKKALDLAQKHGFFVGCDVFIDGFTAFMSGENDFIKTMIEDANSVNVCMLSNSLNTESDNADIFFSAKKTLAKLKRMAQDLNKPVKEKLLTDKKRWKCSEFAILADNFLQNKKDINKKSAENIEIYSAVDTNDECEYIAAKIGDLTRNQGYRYRDIVAVTRNSCDYTETIHSLFNRYNIPVFYDKRSEIFKEPLIFTLVAFLTCASEKNSTDSALSLLKSLYSPFNFEDVCALENYCFIWNKDLNDFKEEFKNNPNGIGVEIDEDKLSKINFVRQSLYEIINSFINKTSLTNGETFSKALYDFIEEFKIEEKFEKEINEKRKTGDLAGAVRQTAVWNTTINALEQMSLSLPDVRYTLKEMCELFIVAISASDFGSLPQHLDEVSVSDANRVRYNEPKVVFMFGVNDGEFPQIITDNLMLNTREREYLINNNLEIAMDTVDSFSDERLYAYNAVTAPSEKLFVSHSQSADSDFPSVIINEIMSIFDVKIKTHYDIDPKLFLHTPAAIRHQYATQYQLNSAVCTAFESLGLEDDFQKKLKKVTDPKVTFSMREKAVASKLFGKHMRLSATQVEGFYSCSFKYFCEKGLRARPRQKAEMSPIHSGTFIHHCLYHLIMNNGKDKLITLSEEEIFNKVDEITREYIKNELAFEAFGDDRFEALILRLRNSVTRLVLRIQEEFRDTDFYPVNFEAKIGINEEIEPITITLSNGSTLCVEGAVDRIDEFEENGVKYIRVIDYKSGKKEFKLSDVMNGLNMQMLLYLFTLCDDSEKTPAGILYMPSGDEYVKAEKNDNSEDIKAKRLKSQCMNGLILDDPKIIRAMEKSTRGIYIPAKINSDGKVNSKSIATHEEFVAIRKTIEENLVKMGEALQEGKFEPNPTSVKNYDACKYCPYTAICSVYQNDENIDINN